MRLFNSWLLIKMKTIIKGAHVWMVIRKMNVHCCIRGYYNMCCFWEWMHNFIEIDSRLYKSLLNGYT